MLSGDVTWGAGGEYLVELAAATGTGGVIGFDAARLGRDTAGFANALGGETLHLALRDGDAFVDFVPTPVPNPHVWMLMLAGLGCMAGMTRR